VSSRPVSPLDSEMGLKESRRGLGTNQQGIGLTATMPPACFRMDATGLTSDAS
jgi:hypothetical protein